MVDVGCLFDLDEPLQANTGICYIASVAPASGGVHDRSARDVAPVCLPVSKSVHGTAKNFTL